MDLKVNQAHIKAIQQANQDNHQWSGFTDPVIMYLGQNDGNGNLQVTNAGTNSRVVWAWQQNKPPEVVDLPPWAMMFARNDKDLEATPVWTVIPPNQSTDSPKRRMIFSMAHTIEGQASLGSNGVTPFESEHNQLANILLSSYPANFVMATPDISTSPSGGQLAPRRLVLNDIPTGVTVGQSLYLNAVCI